MSDSPRPCRVIITEALSELRAREDRLAKLESELSETRAAIKALRKLVGESAAPLAATATLTVSTPERPSAPYERGGLTARAIEAVRTSLDPLSKDEIAERCGARQGLHIALKSALVQGKLILIGDDRYGIPAAGATAEDLAVANGAA